MGIFDRLKASNKFVTTTEAQKYPTLANLPKFIVSWDYSVGQHSGYVCHEAHKWDRDLHAWVCRGHMHHEGSHMEVVGNYEEWKKKH